MAASNQYRDYARCSFLRYSFSIVNLLFVLVGPFLFISVEWIGTGGNKKNSALPAEILDRQVDDYEKGLIRFTSDYRILEALKDKDSGRATGVSRLLYEFSARQPIWCSFVFVGSSGIIVSSNLLEGNRDVSLNSMIYQSLFEKMALEPDKIFTLPGRLNYVHGQEGDLILSRIVSDSSKVLGYLFFDLSDEQIYEMARNYPLDDVTLTDRHDDLIFSIGRRSADPMEKYPVGKYRMEWEKGNMVKVSNKRYYVQKEMLLEGTLVLYALVPMKSQRTLVSHGMPSPSLVGMLILVTIPPLIFRIARKNLEAIDELQTSMTEIGRSSMDYGPRDQVSDEFKVLGDVLRKMVLQRGELILHNSELAGRKRVMKIKQLRKQFNPHFIFNVLGTLRYEIVIDGTKASDTVMALADLMRYSIYYGSTIIPLQTDIENVNDYLLSQKIRYDRRPNYHIDIPEELLGCGIPKLLLQSVVENSLAHGTKGIHSASVIINAWMAEGNLRLCVEDDGSGISKEKLEKLRGDLEQEDIYREHIGLYNPHRVVGLLYGPVYGMVIDSGPGKGTRVVITLPAEMEDGCI